MDWRRIRTLLLTIGMALAACGGAETETGGGETEEAEETDVVREVRSQAVTEVNGVVAVDAGFASDGVQIEIPDGFLSTECRFTAAAANIDGSAISTSVSISDAGLVSCRKLVQERENVPPEEEGCVASYTVICVDAE